MTKESGLIRDVSDTALWAAAYRAGETDRRHPLFRDPFARRLPSERGFEIARAVRTPPARLGARVNVILRTAVIDEIVLSAVRERGVDAVLNLAAGLDTRPYRLDLPDDLCWVETDLPGLLGYKQTILADESPRCRLERTGLDLTDVATRRALFRRVDAESRLVLMLSEGLLGYLTAEQVSELATDLREQPTFAEWVADFAAPQAVQGGRNAADGLASYASRAIFAPAEGIEFFAPFGWRCAELHDLVGELSRFGRGSRVRTWVLRHFSDIFPKPEVGPRIMGVARLDREGIPAKLRAAAS